MANQIRRLARQGSWSAFAALVVASVAMPAQPAPAGVQAATHASVSVLTHAAPAMKTSNGTSQDMVHRTPWP